MLVLGASPTIRDCVLLDNDAGAGGRGGEGAHGVDGFSSGEDGENGGQGATGGTGGDGGGLYVDGGGSPVSAVKFIQVGDMLTLDVSSPGMTFVGSLTAMVVQAYPNGTSLPPDPGLPGLAISPFYPNLVIFIPGPGTPLGPPLLGPGGFSFNFLMPPGAAGLSTRWQAVPFSPAALNGIYAASVAHDIVGP